MEARIQAELGENMATLQEGVKDQVGGLRDWDSHDMHEDDEEDDDDDGHGDCDVDDDDGQWTADCVGWILDCGQWMVDNGRCKVDC